MFCKNCGRELEGPALRCPFCDTELAAQDAQPQQQTLCVLPVGAQADPLDEPQTPPRFFRDGGKARDLRYASHAHLPFASSAFFTGHKLPRFSVAHAAGKRGFYPFFEI